jgi:hypothetical protein
VEKEWPLVIVIGVGLLVYLVSRIIETYQSLQKFKKRQVEFDDE